MKRAALAAAAALCVAAGVLLAEAKARPKESPTDPVMCVVCGDYTFDRRDATPAAYQGKRIYLCSMNELALIERTPDKYIWATALTPLARRTDTSRQVPGSRRAAAARLLQPGSGRRFRWIR